MRRVVLVAVAGVLLAGTGQAAFGQATPATPAAPAAATAAPAGLPDDKGLDTLIRVCSGCHAPELVANKQLTEQEWFDLVQFMGDRGAQGNSAEMAEITAYLTKHFGKEAAPAQP